MDGPTQAQKAPRADAVPDSLFEAGRNCFKVAHARRAALLIDGEDYFGAFMRAAERAQRSILIVGWDFNSRTRLRFDGSPGGAPVILGDFLNYLARRRRRLRIHILDWDFPMIFGTDREFPLLYGTTWKPHRRVQLRYDNTHPTIGSHHQKIVVIDDAMAFSGGLDLTCRRWDSRSHTAADPRRTAEGEPYPPFHDAMMAVDGEAARVLAAVARERWLGATGRALPPVSVAEDPWPPGLEAGLTDVEVAVSRTVPLTATQEVREVEALYLDMIAKARKYIYIENQYFTSHRIGAALAARLEEPDGPEIVVVSRLLSHGWLEEHTMHVLRTRLVKLLREADKGGRFHIYYPHVPGLAEGTCVDVHSKIMVVDDEWLRIGSANLCNRSMGMDTECDLTVEARGRPETARATRDFRNGLLSEHLGQDPARVQQEIERTGTLSGAIEALRNDERSLRPLEDLPDWPDSVVSLAEITDPERPVSIDQLILEFSPDSIEQKPVRFAWGRALAFVAIIAGLMAMWRYTPLAELVSAERVIEWAEDFAGRPWAPFALVAAYTPASFVMFPRPLITLAAVVAFGPWPGVAYAMAGILLAAIANFLVGRLMSRARVRRIAGERLNRISEVLRRRGLVAMTAVRLVPVAPFPVVGLVAGAIRVKFSHYVLGSLFGMLPGAIVTTIFGDQLQSALRDASRINYWVIAGVVIVFAVGIYAVRRWFNAEFEKQRIHGALQPGPA